ncbi:MAG: hypothetical protein WA459_02985 [Stellaceae bacterium]
MRAVSRRSFIHRSLGLAAAGAVARPYVANSAAATATVWWTQGFAQEEDVAFKKIVADYEKASGNRGPYVQQGLLAPSFRHSGRSIRPMPGSRMADGVVRHHDRRDDAAGGGAEGVQAGRGDFREIPGSARLK